MKLFYVCINVTLLLTILNLWGGIMTVSESKKRVMVSLTKKQDEELTKLAKERGFSKSAIVALALERFSRKESEQKK